MQKLRAAHLGVAVSKLPASHYPLGPVYCSVFPEETPALFWDFDSFAEHRVTFEHRWLLWPSDPWYSDTGPRLGRPCVARG